MVKIINDNGMIWAIEISGSGRSAKVAFYDTRYEFSNLGQFVSRYYISTLLENGTDCGLDLYGGEPSWKISKQGMDRVRLFLRKHIQDLEE